MNISDAIAAFNYERTNNYKHEIDNFLQYFIIVKGRSINDENLFNGIRTKDIIQSLDYVIDAASYTTHSMANKYKSAISELLHYLIDTKSIENTDLYDELVARPLNPISYSLRMNEFISVHAKLKAPKNIDPLTESEAIDLVLKCDYILDTERSSLEYMSGCISIKLMLLIGSKYEVLFPLPFSSYSNGQIIINSYRIHLPPRLNSQISAYIDLVLRKLGHVPDFLLLSATGKPLNDKTGGGPLVRVMKELLGTSATMCLTKYGIKNLIKADVNNTEITALTGAGKTIISDCVPKRDDPEREIYINSRLSKLNFFYRL